MIFFKQLDLQVTTLKLDLESVSVFCHSYSSAFKLSIILYLGKLELKVLLIQICLAIK